MSDPGSTGERQEHLDAIIAFADAKQRRRLSECRFLVKWTTRDLPEECRFLLNTQLMFLVKEKDPTTITADILEDRITYDQSEVDPNKVRPVQMAEFLRKCLQATPGAQSRRDRSPPSSNASTRCSLYTPLTRV